MQDLNIRVKPLEKRDFPMGALQNALHLMQEALQATAIWASGKWCRGGRRYQRRYVRQCWRSCGKRVNHARSVQAPAAIM